MPIFAGNRGLLDRFRNGEPEALTHVYEYYVDEVATLARRGFTIESQGHVYVTGADADAQHELVQETFMRAFSEKARVAYDGIRPYRPFLLRITKNLMIDRFRLRKKTTSLEGVGDIDDILESNREFGVDAGDHLYWHALRKATQEFLAQQSEEIKNVVRLRFEQELSQEKVAAMLGCTRRRVRTIETRVSKLLRQHLKGKLSQR